MPEDLPVAEKSVRQLEKERNQKSIEVGTHSYDIQNISLDQEN